MSLGLSSIGQFFATKCGGINYVAKGLSGGLMNRFMGASNAWAGNYIQVLSCSCINDE